MADITVKHKSADIKVNIDSLMEANGNLFLDYDNNGTADEALFLNKTELLKLLEAQSQKLENNASYDLKTLLGSISGKLGDESVNDIKDRLVQIMEEINALKKLKKGESEQAEAKKLEGLIKALKDQAYVLAKRASFYSMSSEQRATLRNLSHELSLGVDFSKEAQNPSKNGPNGKGASAPKGMFGPKGGFNFGVQMGDMGAKLGIGNNFMNNFAASSLASTNIMDSWEEMGKSQEKMRMMQLFFIIMKMASSGDLGMMALLMRLTAMILSKDRANQLIRLQSKNFELQERHRVLSDKIAGFKFDKDDPLSSMKFQQAIQKNKAETDAIGLAQRTLMQLSEQYLRDIEADLAMAKNAADIAGSSKRKLSGA